MSTLIRLVYASRSTFEPGPRHQGLDPSVARILAKSRRNNAKKKIVGALLFGDGCFLQCLEGEPETVTELYRKIEADRRHRDVSVLYQRPIAQRSFGAWSMKYVPGDDALSDLMRSWGLPRFDPYALSRERIEDAIEYMRDEAEPASTLPGDLDDAPQTLPGRAGPDRIVDEMKPSAAQAALPRRRSRAAVTRLQGSRRLAWVASGVVAVLLMGALLVWLTR